MKRQLLSCGHHDQEENHSKSMWDVLSFTNLPSPSRPESFWRKSEELQRTLPFASLHKQQKLRVAQGYCNQGNINNYCVSETATVHDISTLS